MCGIAGFWGRGTAADLAAMTGALAHRGPDGQQLYECAERSVFLGHRRLAVLDIAGGQQPMWNEDGTVGVVFNGEIYNHRDLRRGLEADGHVFRSDHSDTEVLVHGYEQWGERLPDRLNGMFAFAVWDERRGTLFLARDRFGKKPLYYAHVDGLFAFASEMTALLRHPAVPADADRRALQKFFAHAFFPAPHTPYRAIRKLPAGHTLTFEPPAAAYRLERYWRFEIDPVECASAKAEERCAEELRHLLSQAVARRLESDVPLGFLVSGGIDSSTVLALAADHLPADSLHAFAMGFTDPSFDEADYARRISAAVGCRHHEDVCDLDRARETLAELLSRIDEPMGDSSILPTYLVSAFARRDVTVALGGDGGDEMFAGYDPFRALGPSALYRRLTPRRLDPAVRRLADLLPSSDKNMSFDFKVRRWLRGVSHPPALWNPVWMGALAPDEIAELFGERIDGAELYSEVVQCWQSSPSDSVVDRTLEFFTNFYLQDGILTKADRASMLVSLELRSPFLDLDVVEFARRLPWRLKFRNGERKYILKKAVAGLIPAELRDRRKKGFGIPLAKWLRELPPPPPDPPVPFVDEDWLRAKWALHRDGRSDYRHALWAWMVLKSTFSRPRAEASAA